MPWGILSDSDRARLGETGFEIVGWSSGGGGKACCACCGAVTAGGMLLLMLLPVMWMLLLMAKVDAVDAVDDNDVDDDEAMGGIIGMAEVNSAALVLSSASVSKGRKFR